MANEKILSQLEGFISKTKEGKIDWKYLNANVVRFTREQRTRTYTITLQAHGNPPRNHYIFTIQITSPNETLLQIQTNVKPEYYNKLEELFEEAMGNSKSESSKAIDDLLDNL